MSYQLNSVIASLIAHGVVLGLILVSYKIQSPRIQEKHVDVSRAFTLIGQDLYKGQMVSSLASKPFCKHTVVPESDKTENSVTVNSETVQPNVSAESVSGNNDMTSTADSIPKINKFSAGQNGKAESTAKKLQSMEKDLSGYIDETKINGGLKSVYRPPVPYPQAAQNQEIEGDVEVAFMVSLQGTVEEVMVIRASDPVFVDAVKRVVKSWRFKPVIVQGVPMRVKTVQRIEFRLVE